MSSKKNKTSSKQSRHSYANSKIDSITERLRDSLKNSLKRDNFDRDHSDYPSKIRKIAEEDLQESVSMIKNSKNSAKMLKHYCLEQHLIKRRVSAEVKYAPFFAQKYEKEFPVLNIEREFSYICSEISDCTADITDREYYITLACALFILDELSENGSLCEASAYIPQDRELLAEADVPPDFCDACHEDDLIRGMVILIKARFCDGKNNKIPAQTFYNEFSAKRTEKNAEPYGGSVSGAIFADGGDTDLEAFTAAYEKLLNAAEQMTLRERFDKVMSYIRPGTSARAVKNFSDCLSDFIGRIFKELSGAEERRIAVLKQELSDIERLIRLKNKLDSDMQKFGNNNNKVKGGIASLSRMNKLMNVPAGNITSALPTVNFGELDEHEQALEELRELMDKMDNSKDRSSKIEDEKIGVISYSVNTEEYFDCESEEDAPSAIKEFNISDPYEICYAVLYLLDTGSDLPWLVSPVGMIVTAAVQMLPWYPDADYRDENDMKFRPGFPKVLTLEEEEKRIEKKAEMYKRNCTDYILYASPNKRVNHSLLVPVNLPQLIHSMTGMIMPRDPSVFDPFDKELKKSGITGKNLEPLKYCFTLAMYAASKNTFPVYIPDTAADDDVSETDEAAADELRKTIASKNEQIAVLKGELREKTSRLSAECKKYEKLEEEYNADKQELIELRELVYKLRNSDPDEEFAEQAGNISLPYSASARIVIFGGHDSWLRAIRPMLPNVRFIDPYTNPDVNLIRNADVVWMQSNAMPHSYYNKIMDIVRQRKIPVKYFAYASAEKCAYQLAEDDMKGGV